jgi:hypothetical protein
MMNGIEAVAGELLFRRRFNRIPCPATILRCAIRPFFFIHRYLGPLARTWQRPFHSCGLILEGPTSERESLPTTLHEGTARHTHFPGRFKSPLFY